MQEQPGLVRGIQVKVLIGFGVALLALAAAGLINFISLNRLVDSVKTLSQPDEKLICVRQLMEGLSNEESTVRSYTLTQNEEYLNSYRMISDSVHSSVTQLKRLTFENAFQSMLADSVQQLVGEREGLLNQFIKERKSLIDSQNVKSTKISASTNQKKTPSQEVSKPVVTVPAVKDTIAQSKDDRSWIAKVLGLGKKKKKSDEVRQEASTKDTLLVNHPVNNQVKSESMAEVLEREKDSLKKQMLQWGLNEVVMLQHDKEIVDLIRSKVTLIEENENTLNAHKAEVAKKEVDRANFYIIVVGVLGILSTLIFIYLILTDIARGNRLRAKLIEERKRAEKLARVKEEFLANMSHEIRTPLNSISGFADQLSKENQTPRQKEFTQSILRSADHLLSIVNQILDYAKIESGKVQHDKVSFDFREMIQQVQETFTMQATGKGINFNTLVERNIPPFVEGDVVSVKQIIINLVSNAIKFTESGSVNIHSFLLEESDDEVRIKTEVRDTGIGIPAEMQQKIFEEFTQSDYSVTRKFGGTGLGLAITKKLTDSLQGKIELTSKEGEGSVFSVIIPFVKTKQEEEAGEEMLAVPVPSALRNKSVLIVDDEEMNVLLAKTIFEKWEMKTDVAQNGKAALEKIQNNSFDLVLLDVQMPVMSGPEAARQIRESNDNRINSLPLIALTANVYTNQQTALDEAGFNMVITKPFKEEMLLDGVKKMLLKTEIPSVIKNEIGVNGENGDGKLYNLEYLEKTSGSNTAFIISMIESFVTNNTNHLQLLNEALETKDWENVHRLTHKMIPSFSYLEAVIIEKKLKQLEEVALQKSSFEKAGALFSEIKSSSHLLFSQLQVKMEQLTATKTFTQV